MTNSECKNLNQMWLLKLAWKNIWRNRSRTIITMAAVFFAVILSIITSSLQDGIFDNLVKNMVSFYSGYVQVHRKGYWDEQILDNSFKSDASVEKRILRDENVNGFTSRLESFGLASSDDVTKGCMVVGIDPDQETRITRLENKLIAGAYLAESDNAVLLSEGLARRLKLKVADTVILIGQGYHGATAAGKYTVKGILQFGSPDLNDKVLFIPLAIAQQFYSAEGMLTSYVLSLKNADILDVTSASVQSAVGDLFSVITWEKMMPEIKQHIQTDTNYMKIFQGILYLLICFGILGTLLVMMVERKFELGMLVAIGFKKIKLIAMLLAESVMTVSIACLLGIVVSIPVVYWFNLHPLTIGGETAEVYKRFGFEAIFPTSTESVHFINQGLIVLMIGLIISLYPVYKVIRLDPVSAMRT